MPLKKYLEQRTVNFGCFAYYNCYIISISESKQINLRTWLYLKLYYSTYSHFMFPSTSEKERLLKLRLHYSFILL